MIQADVVVVGAGPAGAAAAITLAEAGRSVLVVDKARFPRDKTCGDGLTTGALRLLERLGVPAGSSAGPWQPVHDVVLRAPGGREVTFDLPAGPGSFAAVVPRIELDAALVARAREAGADVREGASVVAARSEPDRIVVDVDGLGPVAATYAVGADGMWSPLRKALAPLDGGYRGEWHAARQYVSGVTGRAARQLWVSFDEDLLPGYVWAFPLPDGRANVGFGVLRSAGLSGKELAALWRDVLDRPHLRAVLGPHAEPEGTYQAWPIPARVGRMPLSVGRALFAGDAAAATDLLTGEGIGQALQTGLLAAEAILAGGASDAGAVGSRYERAVRSELGADHRMSAALSRILSTRRGADWSIRVAGATGWTRRNFARWLFEDEPRGVLLTPRRWHRGFLSRPGAYQDA